MTTTTARRLLPLPALLLPLLAATGAPAHASMCYALYDARGALVYRSTTSPVDLSQPISRELARRYPRHHLVFGADAPCPPAGARSVGALRGETTGASVDALLGTLAARHGIGGPTATAAGSTAAASPWSAPQRSGSVLLR